MFIIKLLFLVLYLIVVGLAVEYLFHPKYNLKQLASKLGKDIGDVAVGLFQKPSKRQSVDINLLMQMRTIVEPFSAHGMDIDVGQAMEGEIPFLGVFFVPNKRLSEEELGTITDRVKIKFVRYINTHGLPWKCFAVFSQCNNAARICVYYSEFAEDVKGLLKKYNQVAREYMGPDYGCLRDEKLEKEIKDANNNRL